MTHRDDEPRSDFPWSAILWAALVLSACACVVFGFYCTFHGTTGYAAGFFTASLFLMLGAAGTSMWGKS